MLSEGDKAPSFTLPDQNGEKVKLSDLKGQTVVLYFYPRADTPGCTTQACGVRDRRADYAAAGARVIGISPDEVGAIDKFAGKYDLGFTLARRRRPRRGREVRRLGREVDVRPQVHGRSPRDLHHRSEREDRQGLPQGSAEKAR
jgi:hypothetical protein